VQGRVDHAWHRWLPEKGQNMELFLGGVLIIAIVCGVGIMAVACVDPEISDAHQIDVHESHPLEAPTQ
jgi:hypothetical protein